METSYVKYGELITINGISNIGEESQSGYISSTGYKKIIK